MQRTGIALFALAIAAACGEPVGTGCASSEECEAGLVCELATGRCVECVADSNCGAGMTCVSNTCRSATADAGMDGGSRPDAGGDDDAGATRDGGGVDASTTDASTTDASIDASTIDAASGGDGGLDAGADAEPCTTDACRCARAAAAGSTAGCEFWPTVTPNSQLDAAFGFGVLVSNGEDTAASVAVGSVGGAPIRTAIVPAGGSTMIPLPRIAALDGSADPEASALVAGGAYHLTSTVPVSVTQLFAVESTTSTDFAYTVDGSLLLPTHALGTDYTVISRPTQMVRIDDSFGVTWLGASGFASIVAAEAASVTVTSSAHVAAGTGVGAMTPSSTVTFTLARGDVLVLLTVQSETCPSDAPSETDGFTTRTYCLQGPSYDLTGTTIHATGRVQVIGGHDCTFVPYHRWACDHLESSLLPDASWGQRYLVARTPPFDAEPNVIRLVNGPSANTVTLEPPLGLGTVVLGAGEVRDFETGSDVELAGTAPFAVAQHMVGQLYAGLTSGTGGGDPSMAVLFPVPAWAGAYTLHTPATFEGRLVLVAPTGSTVTLDGAAVTGWTPVGTTTGMSTARVTLSPGFHRLSGSTAFSGASWGFGDYSSYLVPLGGAL